MTQRSFYHSEEALAYRVKLLFNFAKFVSKKFGIPFTYDLADFAQVLPLAVQDQLYYCVDYRINPNGYDTSKLTAFLAYHLVKTSQYEFNSFPMFYGYLLLLQAAHCKNGWPDDFIEKGFPHLRPLCENLHTFLRNLDSPVPSYAFLKGVQLSLRATSHL